MSKNKIYPAPSAAKLSVVIPVYNAEIWMKPTLEKLWASLSKTKWKAIEIIVVDDGSSDGTAAAASDVKIGIKVNLIVQKNAGRYLARKTGLDAATGDYVFFIDSRVFADPGSFQYLVSQMNKNPDAVIWNGHVEVDRKGNPFARFWHTVTFIAWRKYMANPRLVHYGIDDFDYYPKGTTCFLAPRDIWLRAYSQFKTNYADLKNANDDSSLIRYMVTEADIYIAPEFVFTYHSRSTLKAFIKHTSHRGVVFVDGFFKPGTRYYYPLMAYLSGLPVAIVAVILWPILLLLLPAGLLLGCLIALALKVDYRDASAFILILPVFMIFYTVGLYQGIYLSRIKSS
jgi:glycosyltransferase involved in cell wall biosynthesis